MKRFKIVIETSTSCVGKCVGCALTPLEKSSLIPPINQENLSLFFKQISYFYHGLTSVTGYEHEMIVVELVIGEHFTFDESYLQSLFQGINEFLFGTGKKYIVAISTSGLLPDYKILPKLELLARHFTKSSSEIHLVCNFNFFDAYKSKYDAALTLYKKYFDHINILTNFDGKLDLNTCPSFKDFLQKHQITDVQLVYGLKSHNLERFEGSKELFYQIHDRVILNQQTTHRRNDIYEASKISIDEDASMQDILEKNLDSIIDQQVFISSNGDVHHIIPTMIGGIELDKRGGFKPVTNISDSESICAYRNSKSDVVKFLLRQYMRSKQCMACNHSRICYSSGLALLQKFFVHEKDCHNPMIPFYENKEMFNSFDADRALTDWKQ